MRRPNVGVGPDDEDGPSLHTRVAAWMDIQQVRKALAQRHMGPDDPVMELLVKAEAMEAAAIKKELRRHILWPWLSKLPGLGGVHTARLISIIGDPRRFPGQRCSEGHHRPPGLPVGSPCPVKDDDETCPGIMEPARTTSGVRSLYKYLALHADENGKAPRKRKGQKANWHMVGRASVMQPDGIADHIVKHRTPGYREIYDLTRERLERERGVLVEGAERSDESENAPGSLRPFQVHNIARKVAAKAFVGDLLTEWKRLLGEAETQSESDATGGLAKSA